VKHYLYTVDTQKSFNAAVEAVVRVVTEKGYRVMHTYDVAATLAAEGFHRGPLKIIEVCNPSHANEILQRDVSLALMLPCPIVVYTEGEKTFISTMRPAALAEFSPGSGLEDVASQMEAVFLQIVNEARG
jgi:uncharacterized protein (DUF302 family)